MKIQVDVAGKVAIEWLVDAVLKAYGIRAREKCEQVLGAVELIEEEPE